MRKRQSGFTLIEIAMVLFIIGLLIVSVLKGATLIHEARVRKTAQMVEDIRTASNLFYREQGRLPGDGGVGGGVTGTGTAINGLIVSTIEIDAFKEELIKGGYLKGSKEGTAAWIWRNALGGVIWVDYRSAPGLVPLNYIIVTGLAADEDRRFLDQHFDDGDPANGNVRYDPPAMLIPL